MARLSRQDLIWNGMIFFSTDWQVKLLSPRSLYCIVESETSLRGRGSGSGLSLQIRLAAADACRIRPHQSRGCLRPICVALTDVTFEGQTLSLTLLSRDYLVVE